MKFLRRIVLGLLLLCLLMQNTVSADRMSPAEVAPVYHNGIKYVANHEKMGYVEAWDVDSGKLIWAKKVYDVKIDPLLEADVQWVFIRSMSIEKEKLIVTNEKNEKFEIDISKEKENKKNGAWPLSIAGLIILVIVSGIVCFVMKKRRFLNNP